jgi:maleate isomerase
MADAGTGVGVVASFDFTRDQELRRWVPGHVPLFLSRTGTVPAPDNLSMVSALSRPDLLARPTREVCAAGARAVIYACTACSFVGGVAGEQALRRGMLEQGAPIALTTAGAMVSAIGAVGARRLAVVHPYAPSVGQRLRDFLDDTGFEVISNVGLDLGLTEVAQVSAERVCRLIRDGDHRAADAIFVSCTGLPTYEVIAPLELELGKPVITANQATMWALLRSVGSSAVGPGQRLITETVVGRD